MRPFVFALFTLPSCLLANPLPDPDPTSTTALLTRASSGALPNCNNGLVTWDQSFCKEACGTANCKEVPNSHQKFSYNVETGRYNDATHQYLEITEVVNVDGPIYQCVGCAVQPSTTKTQTMTMASRPTMSTH